MKQLRETDLVAAVLDYCKLRGLFCWRVNVGAFAGEYKGRKRFVRFGVPGAPDIMAIGTGGRFIAIECKAPKGKQSPAQHAWAFECEAHGGLYLLVRNLDDLIDGLKKI
jgi:hypothetical protein